MFKPKEMKLQSNLKIWQATFKDKSQLEVFLETKVFNRTDFQEINIFELGHNKCEIDIYIGTGSDYGQFREFVYFTNSRIKSKEITDIIHKTFKDFNHIYHIFFGDGDITINPSKLCEICFVDPVKIAKINKKSSIKYLEDINNLELSLSEKNKLRVPSILFSDLKINIQDDIKYLIFNNLTKEEVFKVYEKFFNTELTDSEYLKNIV